MNTEINPPITPNKAKHPMTANIKNNSKSNKDIKLNFSVVMQNSKKDITNEY